MKMLIGDVIPIFDKKATCIECAIKTALSKWNVDSDYIYVGALNFGYRPGHDIFGNRISCNKYEMFKYINCQGVSIVRNEVQPYEKLKSIIYDEVEKDNPIVIHIDTYFCPWNELYGKYHFHHYCAIIGINLEKEVYLCHDTYLTDQLVELPFECLKNGYKDYLKFSKCEKKKMISKDMLLDVIIGTSAVSNGLKMTDRIRRFGDDISHNLDIVYQEIELYSDAKYANILVELAFICWAREQFLNIHRWFFEKLDLCRAMEDDIAMWENMRATLYKQIIIRMKDYSEQIRILLYQIADYEDIIIEKIAEYLKSDFD